jgi:hypothetical protein
MFTVTVSFLWYLRVPVSVLVPHQGTMLQDREICCDVLVSFCAELPGWLAGVLAGR